MTLPKKIWIIFSFVLLIVGVGAGATATGFNNPTMRHGCGQFADQQLCGFQGTTFSTAGMTKLSTAGLTLDTTACPSGCYLDPAVSWNIGSQSLVFIVKNGVQLNLNGQTITGYIYRNGSANDLEIYNGTITANIPQAGVAVPGGGTALGVISLENVVGCSATAGVGGYSKIHDLTVENTSADSYGGLHYTDAHVSSCANQFHLSVYQSTFIHRTAAGVNRNQPLYLQGSSSGYVTIEAYNDFVFCGAQSYACQGVMFYNCASANGTASDATRCIAHNNFVYMPTNTSGQNGRAFIVDGSAVATTTALNITGSAGVEVYDSEAIVGSGRCIRIRNSKNPNFHDINCREIASVVGNANQVARCLHLGDPDGGDNDAQNYQINNVGCDMRGSGDQAIEARGWWDSTATGTLSNLVFACNSCTNSYIGGPTQPVSTQTRGILVIANAHTVGTLQQVTTGYTFTADKGPNGSTMTLTVTGLQSGLTCGTSGASPAGTVTPTITCGP